MSYDLMNADDYGLSFSDEESGINEKIRAVFAESESDEIRAYAANILIGNIPTKKVNESVDDTFWLCGFHVKKVRFRDSDKDGNYTIMFGRSINGLCAYSTSSDKVYAALRCLVSVYGEPSKWKQGINVKIRMNAVEGSSGVGKAYSLEVIG